MRSASHAGSWYTKDGSKLQQELDHWLGAVDVEHGPAKAIIAPHAGYTYSGPTAAYAYKQIDPRPISRVFILGPSHHFYLPEKCGLSPARSYETPLYHLTIDSSIYSQLEGTGQFYRMSKSEDEDEHSIELHLPYVAKIMESKKDNFTIVPILVGSLSPQQEAHYGSILAPYLAQPENLFVISSDFCHWGHRFGYEYYDKQAGEIWQSIEKLDNDGMRIIESLDADSFTKYLKQFKNTICGRHPIGVLLNAISVLQTKSYQMSLRFVRYAQSSKCRNNKDSSVSYASAALTISPPPS